MRRAHAYLHPPTSNGRLYVVLHVQRQQQQQHNDAHFVCAYIYAMVNILYVHISMRWCTFCMAPCSLLLARLYPGSCYSSPWHPAKPYPTTRCQAILDFFLLFKKQQKLKIKIYAKSVKPPPLREWVKRRPIEQFGQLTKMWQSTNCWLSWPCLGILMMIAERMKGPKVCGAKKEERVRKILPAVYLEEEWVSRTMGAGQLWGPIVRQQTVKQFNMYFKW